MKRNAFTLIELLVAIAILGFIIPVVVRLHTTHVSTVRAVAGENRVLQSGLAALRELRADLEQATLLPGWPLVIEVADVDSYGFKNSSLAFFTTRPTPPAGFRDLCLTRYMVAADHTETNRFVLQRERLWFARSDDTNDIWNIYAHNHLSNDVYNLNQLWKESVLGDDTDTAVNWSTIDDDPDCFYWRDEVAANVAAFMVSHDGGNTSTYQFAMALPQWIDVCLDLLPERRLPEIERMLADAKDGEAAAAADRHAVRQTMRVPLINRHAVRDEW